MNFFDFSSEVERAVTEAEDETARLCARTDVGRRLFPGAVQRAGFSLLQPQEAFSSGTNEHVLVVGAASWSDPDLAALDRLPDKLETAMCVSLYSTWTTGRLKTSYELFLEHRTPRQRLSFFSTDTESSPTLVMGTKLSCG